LEERRARRRLSPEREADAEDEPEIDQHQQPVEPGEGHGWVVSRWSLVVGHCRFGMNRAMKPPPARSSIASVSPFATARLSIWWAHDVSFRRSPKTTGV